MKMENEGISKFRRRVPIQTIDRLDRRKIIGHHAEG
jgi:hypothetical protein